VLKYEPQKYAKKSHIKSEKHKKKKNILLFFMLYLQHEKQQNMKQKSYN